MRIFSTQFITQFVSFMQGSVGLAERYDDNNIGCMFQELQCKLIVVLN